jgi:hypothetical protein
VEVLESEIVGLIPEPRSPRRHPQRFASLSSPTAQILERRLADFSNSEFRIRKLLISAGSVLVRVARRAGAMPKGAHLPVQIAALDAEHVRGPRHIALLLGERSQDQVAFKPIAASWSVIRSAALDSKRRCARHTTLIEEAQVVDRDSNHRAP